MSYNSVNDKVQEGIEDASESNYILCEVIANNDPLGINRIQVRDLSNKTFNPDNGEQPWIGPHVFSPFGQGPNYGTYGAPQVGAQVKVKLQDNDVNHGQYEASAYLKAHANPKFAAPTTYGYRDPKGNELFVDLASGEWTWTSAGGFKTSYTADGKLTVTAPAGIDETVTGDFNLNVTGNVKVDASGDVVITADGNVNVTGTTINLN